VSSIFLSRIILGLALAGAVTGAPRALSVPELQRNLQAMPVQAVPFRELRESPWLAAPVESRGTMHSSSERLEKRVVAPRQETWRILPDRMEWVGPDGVTSKQIMLRDAPALAALANALRHVVAGELTALERDFSIELQGNEQFWTVRLRPNGTGAARELDSLELRGTAGRLQVIVVVERSGERTTTRLYP
jgi:hypothetical protein